MYDDENKDGSKTKAGLLIAAVCLALGLLTGCPTAYNQDDEEDGSYYTTGGGGSYYPYTGSGSYKSSSSKSWWKSSGSSHGGFHIGG